jgi:hypothetical protein
MYLLFNKFLEMDLDKGRIGSILVMKLDSRRTFMLGKTQTV